jgi:hypothetical protein
VAVETTYRPTAATQWLHGALTEDPSPTKPEALAKRGLCCSPISEPAFGGTSSPGAARSFHQAANAPALSPRSSSPSRTPPWHSGSARRARQPRIGVIRWEPQVPRQREASHSSKRRRRCRGEAVVADHPRLCDDSPDQPLPSPCRSRAERPLRRNRPTNRAAQVSAFALPPEPPSNRRFA